MKNILGLFVATIALSLSAQEVGVKVDKIKSSEDTTIEISKGKSKISKKYVVLDGNQDIHGDPQLVAQEAEKSWKEECREWKKDFREDNKDNKIISISCGKMACEKTDMKTTCTSSGKYKIKTLSEE